MLDNYCSLKPSVWAALPQTLAYLMANPPPEQPSFGLVTNGDDILFVKLLSTGQKVVKIL